LYFPEPIRAANCEVLKYSKDIPALDKEMSNEQKWKTIDSVYKILNNNSHPVRIALFNIDTIEEIAIIEGKKK
jgi:hypothetical protein